ncbi:hypothetical protein, partial [Escherichia coli]|uniref:hypothetical protein n=1 Tax=Escherichia coli TaxID=562 RepID=UPI0014852A53
ASQRARYPLLLDELLEPNTLYQPTATDAYRDEVRQYLLRVPEDAQEQQLEELSPFKQAGRSRQEAREHEGTARGREGRAGREAGGGGGGGWGGGEGGGGV